MNDNADCIIYTFKLLAVLCLFCVAVILGYYGFVFFTTKPNVAVYSETANATVVLDAGHGGRDGGAVSADGVKEKDLNLSVTFAINDILKLCGVKTVMTRTSDSLVCDESDPALKGKLKMTDLKNRLSIAEEMQNAWLVSIHMNKFSVEKYSGLQVYYSPNDERSFVLARDIQESVASLLQKENTRKVKKAGNGIYLLDRINSPAVLIECGFLSNINETKLLSDTVYRAKLSLIIADRIMANLYVTGNN